MKKIPLISSILLAAGIASPVSTVMAYEAGDWLIRGRVINVNPNDSSGTLSIGGVDQGTKGVKVDSDTVPELDITYMINRNWGVELILGYSEHTVTGEKSWAALGDVIDTKVLPPTLTLQYHFLPDSNIRPYIGAGVNYTYFFDEKVPIPLPVSKTLPLAVPKLMLILIHLYTVLVSADVSKILSRTSVPSQSPPLLEGFFYILRCGVIKVFSRTPHSANTAK